MMKVLLLAGGFGSRLSEYTEAIPKPMVTIGGKPILIHIMEWYSSHGFNDFVIALGYKSEYIKNYFHSLAFSSQDSTIDFSTGLVTYHNKSHYDWRVTLVDTGYKTMTGGRIKRCQKYIGESPFMLTYGDGLCNVNLSKLVDFHLSSRTVLTLTAVRPIARFGNLKLSSDGTIVSSFSEKSQIDVGWINGGFFVAQPDLFDYLDGDDCVLESSPLQCLANDNQLSSYLHDGFWHCMDTKRDRDSLETIYKQCNPPWVYSSNE